MSSNYPIIKRLGTDVPLAADITTNVASFNNILGSSDLDVQLALDSIDDMSFTDISDTISTYNNGRVLFESPNSVTDSANFTYDAVGDILTIGNLQFDLTPTHVHSEGSLHWNDDYKALQMDTEVSDVQVVLGQQQVVRVNNQTGSTISRGSVVYINGVQGQRPTVALADADIEIQADSTIGIVLADISNSGNGYVATSGLARELDTSAFSVGDHVFLSQTPGEITNVKPAPPAHAIFLGIVTVSNATTGTIELNIDIGEDLKDCHDVNLGTLSDGDILYYNASSTLWENTSSPVLELADGSTAITQSQSDNTNKIATTSYVDTAVGNIVDGLSYQGTWDASSNTPTITGSSGTQGHYYVVSAAGTTNIDGVNDWEVADWIIFNGSTWQKLDNTDKVASVFGRSGAVTAQTNDYTWAQIDKTVSSLADITTRSHTDLTDIGTNTHAQIDTHIADATIHFTEASIDHTSIQNVGTNTHAQIDSHIASTSNPHGVTASDVGNTTAQWNADQIQGVTVDDTDIADGKVLQYNSTSGNLEYETVSGGGGGATSVVSTETAATVNLGTTPQTVLCDATSNNITVNLPAASGNANLVHIIKKIDSSVNTVTVDGDTTETIDGATTKIISTQYESITIVCDGSNWHIT